MEAMTANDRHLIVEQLASSEARLLEAVDGLTERQWSFKEAPERWSIAENLEHLVLFEDFIRGVVERAIDGPPEPDKIALSLGKGTLVYGLAHSHDAKLKCRDAVRPTGRWADMAEAIHEFRKTRAQTITFSKETEANLRRRSFAHLTLGDLDGYQWLLLLSQHTLRHVHQIREIKATRAYPVSPPRR
jgi:hypothetical protein